MFPGKLRHGSCLQCTKETWASRKMTAESGMEDKKVPIENRRAAEALDVSRGTGAPVPIGRFPLGHKTHTESVRVGKGRLD